MAQYRPRTPAEVKKAWQGLHNFMDFFGGDRKLAARSCGVSDSTIDNIIKKGYVTPYVALCAQKIPEMPWYPAGLCPYIQYECEWEELKGRFDAWVRKAEVNRRHMQNINMTMTNRDASRRGGLNSQTSRLEEGPPPSWATKDDVIG